MVVFFSSKLEFYVKNGDTITSKTVFRGKFSHQSLPYSGQILKKKTPLTNLDFITLIRNNGS
jgi:hypothetical protein